MEEKAKKVELEVTEAEVIESTIATPETEETKDWSISFGSQKSTTTVTMKEKDIHVLASIISELLTAKGVANTVTNKLN